MGTATVTASPTGVSWEEVKEWDERYYLRPFRSLDEYTHVAVDHGEGSYLVLADGTRILDFMSQYICANLGQSHPRIRDAIVEAAHRFAYLSEPWASDYRSKAAKLIIEDVLGGEGWAGQVRFVATGSESIELALIMAKLYTGRPNIITQEYAYHGWTQGAAGTTGFRAQRAHVSSASGDAREVPGYPPPEYHVVPAPTHYPEQARVGPSGRLTCVEETEEAIRRIGPETIAAFVFDVAQGPGLHPPPEYVPQIRELLDRHGILWIDDEILTGFGRTGKWFGYQHHPGVTPDIMCCAKGIVGAAVPAAAVVVRSEIGEFFKSKRWWLPSTMAAHPLSMAAVVATIEALIEERVVENAARMGEYLGARLRELETRHRCVGHVDGLGLFWAVDLVKNKETAEPFVADRNDLAAGDLSGWPVPLVTRACLERGVFITGFSPNTLRIGPPLNVDGGRGRRSDERARRGALGARRALLVEAGSNPTRCRGRRSVLGVDSMTASSAAVLPPPTAARPGSRTSPPTGSARSRRIAVGSSRCRRVPAYDDAPSGALGTALRPAQTLRRNGMAADEKQGLAAWHSVVRLPEFPVDARADGARRHRPDLPASVAPPRHLQAHSRRRARRRPRVLPRRGWSRRSSRTSSGLSRRSGRLAGP